MQSAKPAEVHGSINRNIVECKEISYVDGYACYYVLIETSWNVKKMKPSTFAREPMY